MKVITTPPLSHLFTEYVCVGRARVCMTEDSLEEVALFFHSADPGDGTQVIRL